MKTTKVNIELVLPPGSHTGNAGSVKTSGGTAKSVTIKFVVIYMVINGKTTRVLTNSPNIANYTSV